MRGKMSKPPPPATTASAIGPCPTVIKIVGRPGTGSLPSTIAPPDHPHARTDALSHAHTPNINCSNYFSLTRKRARQKVLCKSTFYNHHFQPCMLYIETNLDFPVELKWKKNLFKCRISLILLPKSHKVFRKYYLASRVCL